MTDCLFCKIAVNEVPSNKIYEDDHVVAFLDIRPVNKGHSLVIPKIHTEDLLSATDETLQTLAPVVKKVSQAVMQATGAEGINIHVNNRATAGQVIFHLHFHVIPRFSNDGLKLWPQAESEPKTRAEIAEQIKKFIK